MSSRLSSIKQWASTYPGTAILVWVLGSYAVVWVVASLLGHPKPSELAHLVAGAPLVLALMVGWVFAAFALVVIIIIRRL